MLFQNILHTFRFCNFGREYVNLILSYLLFCMKQHVLEILKYQKIWQQTNSSSVICVHKMETPLHVIDGGHDHGVL